MAIRIESGVKADYVQLSPRNMVEAELPTKQKIIMLCDSGATKSLVSISAINSSYLSSLEKLPIKKARFQVGNANFKLSVQGHDLQITGLAMPNLGGIDVVIGTKSLQELECDLDYKCNRLKFRARSILLKVVRHTVLGPHETRELEVMLKGGFPKFLRRGEVTVTPQSVLRPHCPSRMLVRFHKGRARILVHNASGKSILLKQICDPSTQNESEVANLRI